MSYQKVLKEEAEEWEVPYTIWRDMRNLMDGVMRMTHFLDNTQLVKILFDRGFSKEFLNSNDLSKQNLKEMVMRTMFYELCCDQGIKAQYLFSYIEFWDSI